MIGGRIIDFGEVGHNLINDRIDEIMSEEKNQKRVFVQDVVAELNGQATKDEDALYQLQNAPHPTYQNQIKEMSEAGFDWEGATGGSRKKDDITAAYTKYRRKLLDDYLNG